VRNSVYFQQGINEIFGVIARVSSQRDLCLQVVAGWPGIVVDRLGHFALGKAIGDGGVGN
jgi:hypothetical protein